MEFTVHIPRWNELPELDLYMDQVVNLLEKKLAPVSAPDEKPVTAAMINNYVKQKIIAAPERKKYDRFRVAQIFVVAILKKVLSIGEIREVLVCMGDERSMPGAYDMLCDEMESAVNRRTGNVRATELDGILKRCAEACSIKLELGSCLSALAATNGRLKADKE